MTQTLHRSDLDLQTAVTAELHGTPTVDSAHIGVAVTDGTVTLTGTVGSYNELVLLTRATQNVQGVTGLAQEVAVHVASGPVHDADIAHEARQALDLAVDVPDALHVTVRDGHVSLSGSVTWFHQRASAERTVRYLRGVKGVLNEIVLRPLASPVGIEESICAAFLRNAGLEGHGVEVTADPLGVVTLTGTVDSWHERRHANRIAWSAPGVTGLVDRLTVRH
jgi:osmotically-inducible protein OsmY